MDRFAGITAFVQVADSGGFTAAARRLNLSTTTVSEHVQALEDTLGVRLLNRTSRHVSLTDIGHEYYERCAQILQELEEADELASALQTTPRGRLRVYCHQGLGRFIEPVITGFLRRYRRLQLICAPATRCACAATRSRTSRRSPPACTSIAPISRPVAAP